MSNLKLIPFKYDLTSYPQDIEDLNTSFSNLNDSYSKQLGFKAIYLDPAKIKIDKPLPILDESINYVLKYNYILGFNHDGILFMNIRYVHDSNGLSGHYEYTGKNGFISTNNINNINLEPTGLQISGDIETDVNTYHFDLKTHSTEAFKFYDKRNQSKAKTILASGNRLDLFGDPTYLNNTKHLKNLEQKLNTKNIDPIAVKCRYVPNFKSKIFDDCVHLPKSFLFSANHSNIYLLRVINSNNLPYFQNEMVTVPVKHLRNEIWYKTIQQNQVFVLISQSLILWLSNNENKDIDSRFYDTGSASKAISNFNPIEIPAMKRKSYIKHQYEEIAKKYIKANPKATRWLKLKAPFDTRNSVSSLTTLIVYLVIIRYFLSSVTFPFLICLGIGAWLVLTAWSTFNISQVISNTKAILLTIFVLIVLALLALIML